MLVTEVSTLSIARKVRALSKKAEVEKKMAMFVFKEDSSCNMFSAVLHFNMDLRLKVFFS